MPVTTLKKRRSGGWRWLLLFLALGLATATLLAAFPQRVLTIDSGPVTGDVLVVLGGGANWGERALRAVELYKEGAAPLILCTGKGDCGSNEAVLRRGGVPASAIFGEDKSRNTSENARFSLPILQRLGAKRIIIVTSWFHTRRAWHVFHHYAPDLVIYSRPSQDGNVGHLWQMKNGKNVFLEYLKIPEYILRYGVCPL